MSTMGRRESGAYWRLYDAFEEAEAANLEVPCDMGRVTRAESRLERLRERYARRYPSLESKVTLDRGL